jgi:hypothetical protein
VPKSQGSFKNASNASAPFGVANQGLDRSDNQLSFSSLVVWEEGSLKRLFHGKKSAL